jgi:amino acid transporter
MICISWCGQQAHVFAPGVHYLAWTVFFGAIFTFLNIQGIKTSARVNTALAAGMGAVVAVFFMATARYIFGHPHGDPGFFTRPFYDPTMWRTSDVLAATSIAVLGYIGFDGISTLSEEAENPRRNILLATVLTCFVIGILSALEVYAAQLVSAREASQQRHGYYLPAGPAPISGGGTPRWWHLGRAWGRRSGRLGSSTAWDAAARSRHHSLE